MKLHAVPLLSLAVSTSAFNTMSRSSRTFDTHLYAMGDISRRNMVFVSGASTFSFIFSNTQPAHASLLDEYGSDPKKISQKTEVTAKTQTTSQSKDTSAFEPNLRSNYYYPTNKKRYLPRIKKCNDAIPFAAEAIGSGDWDTADDFVNNIADNTVLPLKLYTSSLSGGGTNVKLSFTKEMSTASDKFEKAQKALVKAVKKKDQTTSSKALEDMSEALLAYRTAGRLTGPDAGGDIPSVDEIRRSACRVQGRSFEKKVQDRDARLAAERTKAGTM